MTKYIPYRVLPTPTVWSNQPQETLWEALLCTSGTMCCVAMTARLTICSSPACQQTSGLPSIPPVRHICTCNCTASTQLLRDQPLLPRHLKWPSIARRRYTPSPPRVSACISTSTRRSRVVCQMLPRGGLIPAVASSWSHIGRCPQRRQVKNVCTYSSFTIQIQSTIAITTAITCKSRAKGQAGVARVTPFGLCTLPSHNSVLLQTLGDGSFG